jgi:hypothetical protein
VPSVNLDERTRVGDCGFDLAAMTHDARVAEEPVHIARAEASDSSGLESRECAPEVLALTQNRDPRQSRLESFEAQLLVEASVVNDRTAPLDVVVVHVLGRGTGPRAAANTIGTAHHVAHELHLRRSPSGATGYKLNTAGDPRCESEQEVRHEDRRDHVPHQASGLIQVRGFRLTVSDDCRRQIAARGLTPTVVTLLTQDALGRVDFDRLAPLKGLLKRFFSDGPWTADDSAELASLVGPGSGWWQHALDGFVLGFGWRAGAFRIECSPAFDETFDGPVVPEATPNPRTIRFVTGPIHDGPSRWYASAEGVDDPRVARLFASFDDIENVLVGPDFVAVGLRRPDRWSALLVDVLRVVEAVFVRSAMTSVDAPPEPSRARVAAREVRDTALERAWRALESADPDQVVAALSSPEVAERQVAARLVGDAGLAVAYAAWERLVDDPSRTVRRAAVDAMVDANRDELRPLLEHALADTDAWIRWKALTGLVALGIEASLEAITPLANDTDFRVRLEVSRITAFP